jgi:hypothetical protein
MAQSTDESTGVFRCEQCGRKAGPDMITCPERPAGRCPYNLEEVSASKASCLVMTMAVFGLAVAILMLSLGQGDLFFTLLGMIAGGVLVALAVLGVANMASEPAYLVVNPVTGATWTRVKLLNRTYSEQITLPTRPVEIDFRADFPLHLNYPASIAALATERLDEQAVRQQAIALVERTLTALLAQGWLAMNYCQRYEAYFGGPMKLDATRYLVVPGPHAGAPLTGLLETRIVQLVDDWHNRQLSQPVKIKLLAVGWHLPPRQGIEVQDLVYRIFEKGELDPYRWLLEWVRQDALNQGLWERVPSDWRRSRTTYTIPPHVQALKSERERLRGIHDWLLESQPDLMYAVRRAVELAFDDREAS